MDEEKGKLRFSEGFELVGIRTAGQPHSEKKPPWRQGKPILSILILAAVILGCIFSGTVTARAPSYLDLSNCNVAPDREFLFGTDSLGRDIFSMVWHGGRVSLTVGVLATVISTGIAVVLGALSGGGGRRRDAFLVRLMELLLSVPELLMIVFLQSVLGKPSVLTLSLAIGMTGWMSIAKVVRTEVRQLQGSDYVTAARCMGAGFFYIVRRHLTPNFLSSIMFMVVMNLRRAIVTEAALSFMGLGLPLDIISWGSMLSLSEQGLMTGAWWVILVPGIFLVITLMCVTNIGNYLRKSGNQRHSNL